MFRKTLILTLLITLFIAGCGPASAPTEMPDTVSTESPATEAVMTEAPTEAPFDKFKAR